MTKFLIVTLSLFLFSCNNSVKEYTGSQNLVCFAHTIIPTVNIQLNLKNTPSSTFELSANGLVLTENDFCNENEYQDICLLNHSINPKGRLVSFRSTKSMRTLDVIYSEDGSELLRKFNIKGHVLYDSKDQCAQVSQLNYSIDE